MRITRRIVTASLLAMALAAPAFADDKPTILLSVPAMSFPFFVHMMNDGSRPRRQSSASARSKGDGQNCAPKQTADVEAALTKGVNGIVISPIDVDAMAPALQEAIDAKVPVVTVDRRVAVGDGHPRPCRRRQRQGRRGAGRPDREDSSRTARRS